MKKTTSGFTIVELLIVIVVIAILAAISIVAYTGVQERARMSQMKSNFANIEKALELYRAENGELPECQTAVPTDGCALSNIVPLLSASGLPTTNTLYVRGNTSNPHRWSVRFQKADGTFCQMGRNYYPEWWSSAPSCW